MGSGFDNDVMYAENVDFSGGSPVTGKVTTNGQLLIGSTVAPNIRVNTLTAGSGILITNGAGTISVATNSSVVGQTITGDSGGALSPTLGNWDILGQQAGSVAVMDTVGTAPSTLRVEDRTWISSFVVDPSATVGLRGTYQTIAAAIAAAVSGQTIYVRPGSYSENITLKAGVNLCAMTGDAYNSQVTITGTITATYTGNVSITGFRFNSLNVDCISMTSGSPTLVIKDCYCFPGANDGGPHYFLTCSAAAGVTRMYNCQGDLTPGTAYFNISNGVLYCQDLPNFNANSSITNKVSGGQATFYNCKIDRAFACSGGTTEFNYCYISDTSAAVVALALTVGSVVHAYYTTFAATTAQTVITIAAACRLEAIQLNLDVDATTTDTMITNAGTFTYDSITQRDNAAGPGKGVVPVQSTTAVTTYSMARFNQGQLVNITTPGAYPYTTLASDYVILVDSSAARTITPLASPLTGQTYRIKDNVGSAGANNITITPSGKNIDGVASYVIANNYGSVDICYNGTQWVSL